MNKKDRFFNLLSGFEKVVAPQNIVNEQRTQATIYIYDEISWWGISAEWFVAQLNSMMDVPEINIRVNTPGGDYFEALAIQTVMAQHPANIIVHIDGIAASAGSFLIRGANKRIMTRGGFLMIHRAEGGAYGSGKTLISRGESLGKIDDAIIEGNVKTAGVEVEQATEWVDTETWFGAEEALDHGFIDEIIEAEPIENIFNLKDVYKNTPEKIRDKKISEPEPDPQINYDFASNSRELELLELET